MSRSKALNIDRGKKRGLGEFQSFTPIPDVVPYLIRVRRMNGYIGSG